MNTSVSTDSTSTTERILSGLPLRMSARRVRHVQGVMRTADDLAARFGIDRHRARLAAVAHDMDRELSPGRVLALVADWGIPASPLERREPKLLHGKVSAERLRREYGVTDRELLDAVAHHTLGAEDFGALGLVLYVADFCEPGRTHLPDHERRAILDLPSLEDMVTGIIAISADRFGALAPETVALRERVRRRE